MDPNILNKNIDENRYFRQCKHAVTQNIAKYCIDSGETPKHEAGCGTGSREDAI